ncbi:acetyl-CoA hydrolase/transferase C-terminal domain-containing protein [Sphingopyxis sp.]|uniref:acetyl-CoA hydrolase/transferase C-terminal domain-containing protein n=1 Tax=Sphingopyxis sp. TaxID=1908224 RepID=UPI003D144194
MAPVRLDLAEIATWLPPGSRILVAGATGESLVLADAVMAAGGNLGAATFTGAFIPGVNRHTYLANPDCRVETFFVTPELKDEVGKRVTFLPLCYNDILDRLRSKSIDAMLIMVTPPDEHGNCSFGPAVDFAAELWPGIPVRIAHINPAMPRTPGHAGIPLDQITAFVEADQPFDGLADIGDDPIANAIAAHIAPYIVDGATLQMGVGKVPGAVLRALTGRRNLRVHSGLIVDAVVDLEEAGALAPGVSVTAGVAIGSERLYRAIAGPAYNFQPVSVTHDAATIAAIPNFVAINSALEVDLLGQAYSELGPKGLMSGPGGASDYARAAKIGGGLRIVALAATAAKGAISRVALPGTPVGPVALGRMDIDIIVTEYGAADIRALTYDARAEALIAIAAPDHRAALRDGWRAYASQL